jgi:hypothetical protein
MRARSTCLILCIAAVIAGCGSSGNDSHENAAPEYATTPRRSLESWVNAVRAGDIEMMCRLLHPPPTAAVVEVRRRMGLGPRCNKPFVQKKLLPHVRAEMHGLKGDLHYGAIDIGAPETRIVIGVVSGESPPIAYAVLVRRGRTQWSIKEEDDFGGWPRIALERPDPAAPLASGRTEIAFSAMAWDAGSNYPNAELWIDAQHINGDLDIHPAHALKPDPRDPNSFGMEPVRWRGAARLGPGRHVMAAAVKGASGIARIAAWVLSVR